jgi:SAM-dependent methyltransferase
LFFLASIPRQVKGKILIIGPRYTNELILARGLGWRGSDIFALDALSYSRKVTSGDAHDMPFPSSFFDSVVAGWVVPYSQAPECMFAEINRVISPSGVVIFGADTCTPEGAVTPHNLEFFSSGLANYRVIGSAAWHQNSGCMWVALQKPGKA